MHDRGPHIRLDSKNPFQRHHRHVTNAYRCHRFEMTVEYGVYTITGIETDFDFQTVYEYFTVHRAASGLGHAFDVSRTSGLYLYIMTIAIVSAHCIIGLMKCVN